MKTFTRAELARCDGREDRPACIGYRGRVYDVSDSFLWKEGRHQALHQAGMDLTGVLGEAPHGEDLLERVPLIGALAEE